MARSLAGRIAANWAAKHLPAKVLNAADAVRREYNGRTSESLGMDDFVATCKALGHGDFTKGLNEIKSMSPKQLKRMKF
jgi:hypothetical protein